jgi:hypothetical protein
VYDVLLVPLKQGQCLQRRHGLQGLLELPIVVWQEKCRIWHFERSMKAGKDSMISDSVPSSRPRTRVSSAGKARLLRIITGHRYGCDPVVNSLSDFKKTLHERRIFGKVFKAFTNAERYSNETRQLSVGQLNMI